MKIHHTFLAALGGLCLFHAATLAGNFPPSARSLHTAVWTGNEMLVWGGTNGGAFPSDGGGYNPIADVWSALPVAPIPPRSDHTAVWTGTEMIVWGGQDGSGRRNDGARYNPTSKTWTPLPASPLAPRLWHSAVWTGDRMIVWGGENAGSFFSDGASYSPVTDSWSTISNSATAPAARRSHTAVWTGTEMIVWGGYDLTDRNDGASYDPASNTWTALPALNAPAGRNSHTAVWTGSEMIVWGGNAGGVDLNSGGRYAPVPPTWRSLAATALTARSFHTAIWDGAHMVVWGGSRAGHLFRVVLAEGGRYTASTWLGVQVASQPAPRHLHTAVWTGREMIVWGGDSNTGGRYDPFADVWTPMVLQGAIDFDDVAGGAIIDTHYAGVTFSKLGGGSIFAVASGSAASAPNVVSLDAGLTGFDVSNGYVDAHFASPVGIVRIDARPLSPPEFQPTLTQRPFLQAFTSSGQFITQATYMGGLPTMSGQVGPVETLSVSSATNNIAFVVFSSQNTAGEPRTLGVFDNLSFETLSDVGTIPGLFNTGVDASRVPLADNAPDSHYTLIAPSPITGTPLAATSAGGNPIPPWRPDNNGSAWISPSASTSAPGGTYYHYRTTFDLTGLDQTRARIAGRWATDDLGTDILINGVSTGQTSNGFSAYTSFNVASGFVPGVNTLTFVVFNSTGTGDNSSGMRVEMSGVAPPGLQILSITNANGNATIVWTSQPGRTYRVQYKDNLRDPLWTDVPGDVTATSGTSSKTVSTGGAPRGIFRVILLP